MWNTIRTPPFVAKGHDGNPQYIAGGFQQQFGVETFIVAVLYGLVSFSVILLTDITKQSPAAKQKGNFEFDVGFAYAGLILLFVSFSLLLALFKVKNGSYPFKLVLSFLTLAILN
jgi:oligosaccharyltransferase complex subunit gamma